MQNKHLARGLAGGKSCAKRAVHRHQNALAGRPLRLVNARRRASADLVKTSPVAGLKGVKNVLPDPSRTHWGRRYSFDGGKNFCFRCCDHIQPMDASLMVWLAVFPNSRRSKPQAPDAKGLPAIRVSERAHFWAYL